MPSSLIPERPLLISPTLAATIGLDETVMLHVLSELKLQSVDNTDGLTWLELDPAFDGIRKNPEFIALLESYR